MILKENKIVVFGGTGMLGSALTRKILEENPKRNVLSVGKESVNLMDYKAVSHFIKSYRPNTIYHCAGLVGGIGFNSEIPGEFLVQNATMAINVIDNAEGWKVPNLYYMGSSCMYPRECEQPMEEKNLFTGKFEHSNEGYAIAKMLGTKLVEYIQRKHQDWNYKTFIPCNLYGPGDNYEKTGHVMAALIRKIVNAKTKDEVNVTIWGSGTPKREFMHVDDAADAIVHMTKIKNTPNNINIGTGLSIDIKSLAMLIAKIVGWNGYFVNDYARPDGFPEKVMNVNILEDSGWIAKNTLEEGIRKSIEEYRKTPIN